MKILVGFLDTKYGGTVPPERDCTVQVKDYIRTPISSADILRILHRGTAVRIRLRHLLAITVH